MLRPAALLLLLLLPAGAEGKTLCRTAAECANAEGICGSRGGQPLAILDKVNVCLGFNERGQDSANGTKAMFRILVDKYSTLSVETRTLPAPPSQPSPPCRLLPRSPTRCPAVRTTMTAPWNERKAYEEIWVGTRGMRTVGQQRGIILPNGDCNATDAEPTGSQKACIVFLDDRPRASGFCRMS